MLSDDIAEMLFTGPPRYDEYRDDDMRPELDELLNF